MCLLALQLAAPTNAGRALLPVPLLKPAANAIADADAELQGDEHLSGSESWRLDWPAMEAAVRGFHEGGNRDDTSDEEQRQRRVCALLLCSPHNPTGHTYSMAELQRLGNFVEKHDLVLCSDEIHAGPPPSLTPVFYGFTSLTVRAIVQICS